MRSAAAALPAPLISAPCQALGFVLSVPPPCRRYGIGMRYGWGSGFPGDRTREYQVELWLWPDDVGGGSGLSAGAARDTTPKSLISSTLTFNIGECAVHNKVIGL